MPRTLSESETIQVKLKRKTSFKHHVLYEAIRPKKCIDDLKWLFENSKMFQNEEITINKNWDISSEQSSWYGFNHENVDEMNSGSEDPNLLDDANSQEQEDGWTADVNSVTSYHFRNYMRCVLRMSKSVCCCPKERVDVVLYADKI